MKLFGSLALALVGICVLFAACARKQSPTTAASSNNDIVFGFMWEPTSFHPLRGLDSASYYAQTLVYEGLVRYDDRLRIVPAAADKFVVSEDGLTYTFHLRPDVRFCDGQPLTMADVIESFSMAAGSRSPYRADYEDIKAIDTLADGWLRLRLSKPCAPLLSRLVELRILPKRIISAKDQGKSLLARKPIGSGAYMLTSWRDATELVFRPNPHYRASDRPFQSLVWRPIPDRNLLALALRNREIDVGQVDSSSFTSVLRAPGLEAEEYPGSRTIFLGLNHRNTIFRSRLVRQALAQAIDTGQIIAALYKNLAYPAATDFASSGWAFDATVQSWRYNPTACRQLLREAGYIWTGRHWQKNGERLAFAIATMKDFQDVANAVVTNLRAIGVLTELHLLEYTTLKRQLTEGKFDAVVFSRSVGPDPDCFLSWHTGAPMNYFSYSNDRLDALLDMGRRVEDRSRRRQIYSRIQDLLAKDVALVFLLQPRLILAHAREITSVQRQGQQLTGLPWDNPLFSARFWRRRPIP